MQSRAVHDDVSNRSNTQCKFPADALQSRRIESRRTSLCSRCRFRADRRGWPCCSDGRAAGCGFVTLCEQAAQGVGKQLHVRFPTRMRQLDTIAISKFLEFRRELFGRRHPRAAHQHWNNGNVTLQGGHCFDAHEIRRVTKAACSRLVFRVQPFLADHYKEDTASGDALFDGFTKVASRLNRGYIHEYRLFAEVVGEIVKQAAGLALRVAPPIADKDAAPLCFS